MNTEDLIVQCLEAADKSFRAVLLDARNQKYSLVSKHASEVLLIFETIRALCLSAQSREITHTPCQIMKQD